MSFKTQALLDLPAFTNVGEFGDTILIDGVAIACVLVTDEAPDGDDGVTLLGSTLYARAADFAVVPEVRERIMVGDRPANITRVDNEQGMLVIRLSWFSS